MKMKLVNYSMIRFMCGWLWSERFCVCCHFIERKRMEMNDEGNRIDDFLPASISVSMSSGKYWSSSCHVHFNAVHMPCTQKILDTRKSLESFA